MPRTSVFRRPSVLAPLLAAMAAAGLSAPPAQAGSSLGGPVNRSEVLSRAQYWDAQDVQYNQGATYGDGDGHSYRTDCSGFIAMAWHLSATGLGSATTQTLDSRSLTARINKSDLRPGDALDNISDHVVLFVRWNNQATGDFTYLHQSNSRTDMTYGSGNVYSGNISSYPASSYVALRYNKVVEDNSTPPPATPVGMTGFAPADFNGDGRTDLAAVDAATGKMFLYPGTGVGTFGERSLIGTNWDSLANMTPGDFNGDGKADIAAVGKGDGKLYVYPGTGSGAFGASWSAGTGWNSLDHFVGGDFNADGRADIAAVGKADGRLYVFPGTGTGWFAAPVSAGTGWNIMRDLVGGDFNADGRSDVAAVQAPQGSTGDMYLYPGTGQNTFGNRSTIGTDW
ncbi:VCBS repeat-containing protein [Streptomyces sp. BE20]|uniref:FG-GAP repeat domain-containing protein n=1 Tax=Streptomyces sp. BE20 TaxID=3002525 RepID=UPI002E76BC60|nr:VCBS repeat-containing protein [Streptomyces sp. BE20]MEE1827881.1 VCBS repeat-containing protein [Streptomyces sp. BE20]